MAILTIVSMLVVTFSVYVATAAQGGKGRLPPPAPAPTIVPRVPVRRPPRGVIARPLPSPTASPTPRTSSPRSLGRPTQIEMVRVPGGTFLMGSLDSELGRTASEGPQHTVSLNGFYLGKYEVTQAQWRAVMGINPSTFVADNRPVDNVSWEEAVEFCRRLSRETGRNYRLPTEAEWEYAARGGTTTPFAFGSSITSRKANFDGSRPYGTGSGITISEFRRLLSEFRKSTTPVGSFAANAFGLHDMHGNVAEWVQDEFHTNYEGAPAGGRAWTTPRAYFRVVRGGSWQDRPEEIRSASRPGKWSGHRANTIGFRVASDSPN